MCGGSDGSQVLAGLFVAFGGPYLFRQSAGLAFEDAQPLGQIIGKGVWKDRK